MELVEFLEKANQVYILSGMFQYKFKYKTEKFHMTKSIACEDYDTFDRVLHKYTWEKKKDCEKLRYFTFEAEEF